MNISLVFPPFFLESIYNLPPLGLINLATMVNSPNRRIKIHDFVLDIRSKDLKIGPAIYDDCAHMILSANPDVVGFSAQCTTYPAVIRIAGKIKEKKPKIKIVIGGHNASLVDKKTLSCFSFIDAIVRGEGEITFLELIKAYENGYDESGIDGVTYRSGKEIIRNGDRKLIKTLDDLPAADYSFVPPFAKYRDACDLSRSIALLEVGRGCPHRCIYCSESVMWQRRTRTFSVERLVNEMRHLHENYGAQCYLLAYDQFTADRNFVERFCHLVIKEELNHLPWYCISRLDTVDAPLLGLMREAGCESMCYGIDSGSKKTLAFIRKKIDKNILYRRVKETTDHGIVPTLSFVIGFPEEEKNDIDETLILALNTGVQGNINPLVQMPTILPGTELYNRYLEKLIRCVDTYFSLGIEFDNGSRLDEDDRLIDSNPQIFSSFYNIPCKGHSLDDLNLIAQFFPLVINLYPKSFLLFTIALGESVGSLFLFFLKWIKQFRSSDDLTLSASDCYKYFPLLADYLLLEHDIEKWDHLSEIVKYETVSIEAAKFPSKEKICNIDLYNLEKSKLKLKKNVIVRGFKYNLPDIVEDLKEGVFNDKYSVDKVILVFLYEDNELEVTQINDFGRDFLNLCDGSYTLKDIANTLYSRYGKDMQPGDFYNECLDAITVLNDIKLFSCM